MNWSLFRLLIFVTLVGVGCQPEPPENAQVRPKPSVQPKALPLDKFPTAKVKVPISQIREAPDITSKQIADLKKGEALALLGPVSDQATKLTIEGQTFIQPWLRVRKTNGTEGWVHAAVLDGELPENIMLKAFLGKDLAGAAASYYQAYADMSDAKSVLQVLQQAHELCNALTLALQIQPPEVAPEVAAILPALTVVWLESDRSWRFFIDYKDFANAAERSAEPIDNEMLKLYYAVYPVDSIGYPYPAWVLEVEENKVYSLLGKGVHQSFISRLDQMLNLPDISGQEIDRLKMLIINDLTSSSVLYWESRAKVSMELEAILDQSFSLFTPSDTIALRESLQSIADTSNFSGQRFNFRAGF